MIDDAALSSITRPQAIRTLVSSCRIPSPAAVQIQHQMVPDNLTLGVSADADEVDPYLTYRLCLKNHS